MNELEVYDLVLEQIGNLRIPVRETELLEQIKMIQHNVLELRKAVVMQMEEQSKTIEPEPTAKVAGCACTSAEEAREDVQSIRDAN